MIDLRRLPQDAEIPFDMQRAQDFLELLLSITEMLQLYQECFPVEFEHDQEQGVPIFPAPNEDYSECEVHFFHLVDKHYFPLPVMFLPEDLYGERHLTAYIPIEPMGLDLYEEDEFEHLHFGWQLLLYLLGEVDEEWLRTYGEYASDDLFEIPISRGSAKEGLLIVRSQAQGGPLAYFELAVQMLRNDTDSVWLNVTREYPYLDAYWTKKDMEEMKREYLLALDIRDKAFSFCQWLEANPCVHFAAVVRLWNSCVRDTPQRESGPSVMEVPASTFLEGINFRELFGRPIALPERIREGTLMRHKAMLQEYQEHTGSPVAPLDEEVIIGGFYYWRGRTSDGSSQVTVLQSKAWHACERYLDELMNLTGFYVHNRYAHPDWRETYTVAHDANVWQHYHDGESVIVEPVPFP